MVVDKSQKHGFSKCQEFDLRMSLLNLTGPRAHANLRDFLHTWS